ncbi:expressed unknown protein [Seminavis robusta]|uniref:Glycosyl transferase family 25 domain-containing protein n=1 Tax=Seminavis robusta TaxID=568900 RepID=A0A9N8HXR9_9STRA|nr:expressed unknown protein [Seminavis robusta]|eukprot:Sro2597_g332150.1 n/a (278) ;mRNA; r:2040-2873
MLLRSLYHRNNHRSMGGGDPLALNGHHKDRAFPTKTIADGNQKPVLTNASKQPVVPINVINLDKDKARWDKVILELQNKGGQLVERFPAVYGKALSEEELVANTTPLARIFCTRPVIGCFLSHRNAWMKVLKSTKFPYQVILEDDAIIACNNFSERIQDLVEELESNGETRDQWDILMLGGIACVHPEQDYGLNILDAMLVGGTRKPRFIDNSTRIHVPYRPEGCHGYVVSKLKSGQSLRTAYKPTSWWKKVALEDLPLKCTCHQLLVYQEDIPLPG